jgi:arylsulfatase A-like enzyme
MFAPAGCFRRAARLGSIALSCILLAGIQACGSREGAAARPDIVLIVLDTVRWDHLSLHGYARPTSPRLDALAERGRVFERAYATGGWTVPSHASLFTGLYPVRHGATQERWQMSPALETLAEVLSEAGYETVGVTGNAMITEQRGFAQGFETWVESWREAKTQDRDRASVAWVERFLDERRRDRPLFLFINLIGPHTPYDSCGESCGAFGAEVEGGIVDSFWWNYYLGLRRFSDLELERLDRLYDAEIREVDANLGRIVDALDQHAPEESTFLAVTSDHGENIGDHGHVNHVFSLHESAIRIPLVIRYPRALGTGVRDDRPAQLVDLFPTILRVAEAGSHGAVSSQQGVDLLEEDRKPRPVLSEYYRPEQVFRRIEKTGGARTRGQLAEYDRRMRAVIEDGWKLVWGSDGRHELYDLESDPKESHNLVDESSAQPRRARLTQRLEELLRRYRATSGSPEGSDAALPALDRATRDELRALGYAED